MSSRLLIVFAAIGALSLGAAGGVWAEAFLLPYVASHSAFADWQFVQDWNERTTVIREVREVVIRLDNAAERVAERAEGMTAAVESRAGAHVITGSGFVITSDGFILTLASAAPQGYETRVYLKQGEEPMPAEVLKRNLQRNLAVLKIDARNLQTAGFAGSSSVRLGAPVVMVAKSLEAGELVTIVNQGNVRTRSEELVRTSIFDKSTLGGSPLLDLEGNIVGLSTFEASGRLVAIPASTLRSFSGF